MDRLWAPWRMPYILTEAERERQAGGRGAGCIFCELPAQAPQRRRNDLILSCGERAFIILNKYPYNNGHLLVVPRAHVPDPSDLPDTDFQVLSELLRRTCARMWKATSPHALNVGMNLGRTAGAGIDEHCHYHIVPRWDGDTNFMPVVGGVKVVSEGLHDTYDRFFPYFDGLCEELEAEARWQR